MQIPTGVLADRLGPQRLIAIGGILTAVGTALFALAPNLFWAGLGRFIIGGSVAVAFVSTLKLTTHWLNPRRYSLSAGLLLVAGMVGAVFAGVPLQLLSENYGWRSVVGWSSVAGVGIFIFAILFVRDDPSARGYASYRLIDSTEKQPGMLSGLGIVLKYRNTWLMTLAPGGIVGAVLTFSGLWGVPFLVDVYQFSPTAAATMCSCVMLAWAVSGAVFSMYSEKILQRRKPYLVGTVFALIAWSLVFLIPSLPVPVLVILLLTAGLSSGGMILGFALAKESVPRYLTGTISGLVNAGVMCGPMVLQPLVGWLLDRMWNGGVSGGGIRIYDAIAFRVGFSGLLMWLLISVILLMAARESGCRPLRE
jgi:MFS family permease